MATRFDKIRCDECNAHGRLWRCDCGKSVCERCIGWPSKHGLVSHGDPLNRIVMESANA